MLRAKMKKKCSLENTNGQKIYMNFRHLFNDNESEDLDVYIDVINLTEIENKDDKEWKFISIIGLL